MKRMLALILALMLPSVALAEVDVLALGREEGFTSFTMNGVDTIIRPGDQPFMGEIDAEDGTLIAFLDFVDMPNEGAVFMRLTISTELPYMLGADTMTLTVGQKDYVFTLTPEINEYDTVYYEDYAACLHTDSLPILEDIIKLGAKAKDVAALHEKYSLDDKPVRVTLSGEGMDDMHGSVVIPAKNVQNLLNLYKEAGGLKQDFDRYTELWPVDIKK